MADDMDRAQARETLDRDLALQAQAARAAASQPRSGSVFDGMCMDCGEPIEPARIAALRGATSRCSSCARDYEKRIRSEQRGGHAHA